MGLEHLCNAGSNSEIVWGWIYRLVTSDRTTGAVISDEIVCVPLSPDRDGPPPPPALPPVPDVDDIWDAVVLPAPELHVNPTGQGVTGLETWFWATGPTTATVSVTLAGYTITGTAHLTEWTIDHGDGPPITNTVPGTEGEPLTRHTYETKGLYDVSIRATWRAEAVMTGPGIPNPTPVDLGTATLTTTRPYRVIEIVPQLVG